MPTFAAYVADGENSLTILALPAYPQPRLLVDPRRRRPGLTTFFVVVFDWPGREPNVMFVMSIVPDEFFR